MTGDQATSAEFTEHNYKITNCDGHKKLKMLNGIQVSFLLLVFVLISFAQFVAGDEQSEQPEAVQGAEVAEEGAEVTAQRSAKPPQKSYGYGEMPASYGEEKPDYSICSGLPKRHRKACKMVVQIQVEARKAERRGLLEDDELPPPSQGLGLPTYRQATKAEEEAQPPPKLVAERYACMNMTCLCPYLGGTSSGPDQCTVNEGNSYNPSERMRRQSGNANPNLGRVVRKEYRQLTDNERARFHAAVLQLKRGFGSYEYNRIAYLHFDLRAMPSAHSGPTFLPWHREYLKRYEIGLRAIDPSVSIPYWDSSLDQKLPNPTDSVMWSTELFGTPNADNTGIADGFLANWITMSGNPIQRQLGVDGELMSEDAVNNMINRREMENIYAFPSRSSNAACRVPNANPRFVVELGHNNVHTWIGGEMSALPTAPQDPVFFLHHCFMDYIWEQWRLRWQTRAQRETQFPTDQQVVACSGSANYRLSATMRPFQDPVVLNRAGLSNDYTDFMYTYAPRPTCRAAGGCGSRFLFCDTTKRTPSCVAKIRSGGDCSTFAGNKLFGAALNRADTNCPERNFENSGEQPCYRSTCVNGRCSGGPRVVRSDSSASAERYGGTSQRKGYGYGYGGNTSPAPTTEAPSSDYTTLSPTPAPPKERACYDNHECCAQWASKGACSSAPRYMNTWCPGACRYDGCRPRTTERAAGRDYHSQCRRWSIFHESYGRPEGWRSYRPSKVLRREKLRNECLRNPHWMACNCPEACNKVKRKREDCSSNIPKDYVLEPVDDS